MTTTVFRPYSESDALRSDRSAGDRLRHRHKVRDAIRKNIADIVAEESIIGQSRDKIIKVPIRGIREYRFIFGENEPGVGTGDGKTEPGQVVGDAAQDGNGIGSAGNRPGVDYYETDITLEELVDIMFEDLELPDLERKKLREIQAESARKRKGFRKVGVRAHLDKKRTAMSRLRRRIATRNVPPVEGHASRFPFHRDDLKYRRLVADLRPQSNAVVLCMMDTSGSMDTMKKYLARSFFFMLYQFVRTRYNNVEVVFIAHDTRAREVSEEEFFTKGESGGTMISSAYHKALEVIQGRYHPSLWNIYAFHCSDGDNWPHDNPATLATARELTTLCNLVGYGEIKPLNSGSYGDSLLELFDELDADNFHALMIENKEDIWPSFRMFLSRERTPETAD
ncbi:MAG: sporulation protein YhbH [Chromatiales bacterium 21-64-14]|nr:MAG: sporulation protein YhbH [Chromatiales bacterium 21-64-14]HQU16453.1 sporulation protein YhbH [Gammaproteobacteria bacterium]